MHLLATVSVLLTLAAAPRGAPSAEEQRLFAEGVKAFDAGDAPAALRAFQGGYAVARDPSFLVRIGEAQEKAGAPAEAAESYRRYLREAPDASERADLEARIARLAPPAAPRAQAAKRAEVEPVGELGAGPAPTLPTAPAPRAGAAVDDDAARAAPGEDEDSGWNRLNVTAWSATAATAVLLGVAAYFGAEAASKESDANRLLVFRDEQTGAPLRYTPDVAQKYDAALAEGRTAARDAKLALLGAAGTAAVATVFFVLDGTRAAPARLALAPTGGGAVGAWTWSF